MTLHQAETELRMAALAYAAADEAYHTTWRSTGQQYDKPLNEATMAACKAVIAAGHLMEEAARVLARVIVAEHGERVAT